MKIRGYHGHVSRSGPSRFKLRLLASSFLLVGAVGSAGKVWALDAPNARDAQDAAGACPVTPVYPLSRDPVERNRLIDELEIIAETQKACQKDAGFYAWLGALQLAQGRNAGALESLERAVLIDPQLPGAQIDYAIVLQRLGDSLSAYELFSRISSRPDLPPALRPEIERQLSALDPFQWRSRIALSALVGYESNLNNAPSSTEITLTPPTGPITLPLGSASQPRAGPALLTNAQWQAIKPAANGTLLLQADATIRSTQEHQTNYNLLDLSATWLQSANASSQWLGRVGLTGLQFGGLRLLENMRIEGQHLWYNTPYCQPRVGLDAEIRRYPAAPTYNGQAVGVLIGGICPLGRETEKFADSINLQWRTAMDFADDPTRPGGDYRRRELRAVYRASSGRARAQFDAILTQQTDTAGFSPLLADNASRTSRRGGVRLEFAWLLVPGLEAITIAETYGQRSNLDLFNLSNRSLYTGLRWMPL